MKNVVGLASAMRLIESACEKGEITIIGEGATPSPIELYNKCVAFINKNYGVDILNLVARKAMEKGKPCECNGSCHTIIVEEDDDDEIIIDLDRTRKYLAEALADLMPYADEDYLSEAIENIIDNFQTANDYDEVESMSNDDIIDIVSDVLCDRLMGVSLTTIKEVAGVIGRHIGNNYILL